MRRGWWVPIAALLLIAASSPTPTGAPSSPPSPTPSATPATTSPGAAVAGPVRGAPGWTADVAGSGWTAKEGCAVVVVKPVPSQPVTETCGVAPGTSTLSAALVLPADLPPGDYTIAACQPCDTATTPGAALQAGTSVLTLLVVTAPAGASTPGAPAPSMTITPPRSAPAGPAPASARVPDLLGDTLAQARAAAGAVQVGLAVGGPADGSVTRQTPAAGSLVARHTLVVVQLARPAVARPVRWWLPAGAVLLAAALAVVLWRTIVRHAAARAVPAIELHVSGPAASCTLRTAAPAHRLAMRVRAAPATVRYRRTGPR